MSNLMMLTDSAKYTAVDIGHLMTDLCDVLGVLPIDTDRQKKVTM